VSVSTLYGYAREPEELSPSVDIAIMETALHGEIQLSSYWVSFSMQMVWDSECDPTSQPMREK
jgi:hypothetical protein